MNQVSSLIIILLDQATNFLLNIQAINIEISGNVKQTMLENTKEIFCAKNNTSKLTLSKKQPALSNIEHSFYKLKNLLLEKNK